MLSRVLHARSVAHRARVPGQRRGVTCGHLPTSVALTPPLFAGASPLAGHVRRNATAPVGCDSSAGLDLGRVGVTILRATDLNDKIRLTQEAVTTWQALLGAASRHSTAASPADTANSLLRGRFDASENRPELPDLPGRPDKPPLVAPNLMQRPRDAPLNVYLLHSLAHIELNAIDVFWDTIARFYSAPEVPGAMFVDLMHVAADEARHLDWLTTRLRTIGSAYGLLPAHDGLWQQTMGTRGDVRARLALIPLVQEARALDAGPRLIQKLMSAADHESARIVGQIVDEEVPHVEAGLRWFIRLCRDAGLEPVEHFHAIVRQHLDYPLPGPFNDTARALANMTEEWYLPVSNQVPTHEARVGRKWREVATGDTSRVRSQK